MDKQISYLPKINQSELLTIYGYSDVEEPCIFELGMYFSVFYCLCYVK